MKNLLTVLYVGLLMLAPPSAAAEAAYAGQDEANAATQANLRLRCLQILRSGLASEEFWPSMHAAEALTLAGCNDEVIAALKDRLPAERDDQRRCGLARELLRAGDRSALPVLFQILGDEQSTGRVHAAESLYKLNETGDGRLLQAAFRQTANSQLRLMAAAALARSEQASALSFLRESMTSDERPVRNTAVWALSALGDATDVPGLLNALPDESDSWSRCMLVIALARLGNAQGRIELGQQLNSTDAAVQTMSAEAVGLCGGSEYRETLIQLLDHSTLDTRVRAAQSLILLSMPQPKAVAP